MANPAGGRKRKAISLQKKLEILEEVHDNPQEPKISVAKRLGLPYSTLMTIIANSADIRSSTSKAGPLGEKRTRTQEGRFSDLDKALLTWFQQKRAANIPVSGPMLQEQALIFAKKLNVTADFKASAGWVFKFKKRCGITGRSVCGEANSVDEATVEQWKNIDLPRIIKNYDLRDIYNTDETGLFFNLLPSKTLAEKGDPCHGGKQSKQRLTVLLTANADGSDKLRPLVIGKSQKPRCFKGVKSFPTEYAANKKAWMTGALFESQLDKLNNRMRREKRKVLLLLDNCVAHPPALRFSNIELAFFPANCTSHLQPLDLGIIAALKAKYRKMLVQRAVAALDAGETMPNLHVLQAMQLTGIAWNQVQSDTIAKCFQNAGVVKANDLDASSNEENELEGFEEPGDWAQVCAGLQFEDFVHYDEDLSTCAVQDDDDIVTEILAQDSDGDSDEIDETVKEVPVKFCEALSALEITKRYIMSKVIDGKGMQLVSDYERFMYECSLAEKKQATIDSFFKPK
ncbi:tigger transposable element-derived protein 6-like [Neodiprion virginianus]|uniref:tigger transposable element-derived protein 6-like n=1 Tax=Neodiprion virginianus TaxID=2961670 RepID=UPI001EE6CF34|nr:tigger transposable element-derived protein 6-like [Neodiprion virginianus]